MNRILVTLVFPLLLASSLAAQPAPLSLRIATYNLLGFTAGEPLERIERLRIVLDAMRPDILVAQALGGAQGDSAFFADVFRRGDPRRAQSPFVEGRDSDIGFYYDSTLVSLVATNTLLTRLRDIREFVVVPRGTADTIHIFSCFLTAGDDSAGREGRLNEAALLRGAMAALPPGHHHMLAGDLNVYRSTEAAYAMLTLEAEGSAGQVEDPLAQPGIWHDNEAFAPLHTQSTRLRAFGGGAGGGLDDRFDFILLSPSLRAIYAAGSYATLGNDGRHLNDSLTRMPNTAAPPALIEALHAASDHLPVYLDLRFPRSGVTGEARPERIWLSEQRDRGGHPNGGK